MGVGRRVDMTHALSCAARTPAGCISMAFGVVPLCVCADETERRAARYVRCSAAFCVRALCQRKKDATEGRAERILRGICGLCVVTVGGGVWVARRADISI